MVIGLSDLHQRLVEPMRSECPPLSAQLSRCGVSRTLIVLGSRDIGDDAFLLSIHTIWTAMYLVEVPRITVRQSYREG